MIDSWDWLVIGWAQDLNTTAPRHNHFCAVSRDVSDGTVYGFKTPEICSIKTE